MTPTMCMDINYQNVLLDLRIKYKLSIVVKIISKVCKAK